MFAIVRIRYRARCEPPMGLAAHYCTLEAMRTRVKKAPRVVRVIRFGFTVFGFIIAVSRNFIALCGLVGAASDNERCFPSRY